MAQHDVESVERAIKLQIKKKKKIVYASVLSELEETSDVAYSPVHHTECMETVLEDEEREIRRERRRKNIISELFETEKTYLNHLEVTQKVLKWVFFHKY